MAGDWIPYDKDLPGKPEVVLLSDRTGKSVWEVVGFLMDFWSWADSQTDTGKVRGFSVPLLARVRPHIPPKFWKGLVEVGWLVLADDGIELPNFAVWLGRSAKTRLKETRRKTASRIAPTEGGVGAVLSETKPDKTVATEGGVGAVLSETKPDKTVATEGGVGAVLSETKPDKTVATGQDKTGENKTNPVAPLGFEIPKELQTADFNVAWTDWVQFRKEKRAPLTQTNAKRQLEMLATHGPAKAIATLNLSLVNGWQGLFPEQVPQDAVAPQFVKNFDDIVRAQAARMKAEEEFRFES